MKSRKIIIHVVAAALATGIVAARAADELPAGLRGFSGRVHGTVMERGESNTFVLKVDRVLNVWPKNEAKEPAAIVGRRIRVGPHWMKGDDGRWHPAPQHESFIRTLQTGETLALEVRNVEGNHFSLLELTADQRARAGTREGRDRAIEEWEQPASPEAGSSTDRAIARRDTRIAELENEVIALREEAAKLRKQLEESRRRR